MKKLFIVLFSLLCFSMFAEGYGLDKYNLFVDIDGANGKYFCATAERAFFPEGAEAEGVVCVVMAYVPTAAIVFLMPFKHEERAAEFISSYTALANQSKVFGYQATAMSIADLVCGYAKKKSRNFAYGGVMFAYAFTNDYYGE